MKTRSTLTKKNNDQVEKKYEIRLVLLLVKEEKDVLFPTFYHSSKWQSCEKYDIFLFFH